MTITPIKPIIVDVRTVGIDVWWDHDKKTWRKKRLRLNKIPLQYRCPVCGKPTGKHPKYTTEGDMKKGAKRIEEWNEVIKNEPDHPFASIFPKDPAAQVYEVPLTITDPRMALMLARMRLLVTKRSVFGNYNPFEGWGGVCFDCRKDGFGYDRDNLTLSVSQEKSSARIKFRGKRSLGDIIRLEKKIIDEFRLLFPWRKLPSDYKKSDNENVEMRRVVISTKGGIDFMWMTKEEVDSLRA